MRPWALRPPLLCSGRTNDFSGSERVISAKSDTLAARRPGVVGLYLRIAMSNQPFFLRAGGPVARLVSLRLPNPVRVRLRLPCRLAVFTDATLTEKIFSTAILICVLFES